MNNPDCRTYKYGKNGINVVTDHVIISTVVAVTILWGKCA